MVEVCMKIKAIIFDLDGTLLDTLEDIHKALNVGLIQYGWNPVSIEFTRSSIGHGAYQLIDTVTLQADNTLQKNVYNAYQKYYDQYPNVYSKPYEGILALLTSLHHQGIKIGVVSNKHHHLVKMLCDSHFPMIDHVHGMKENIPLKPDPKMILDMMDILETTQSEVIFVGDSEADIKAAHHSGINVIAVSYGYRDKEQLKKLNPTYLCHNVLELKKIIEEFI